MTNSKQLPRIDRWLFLVVDAVVLMICFGPLLSFGTIFQTMMETFQTNRAETAAVQSVFIGVTFSFGVISGALVTKFGPTNVILMASVSVPLGFCIAFIAKSVLYLCLSVGVISGVGNSMVFVSSIVVVERVFEKSQRLLALSILNTATVITAIFYPYVLRWLTNLYGLNGMFLILGGVCCNVFVLYTICRRSPIVVQDFTKRLENTSDVVKSETEHDQQVTTTKWRNVMSVCALDTKELFTKPYVCVLLASDLSIASLTGYLGVMFDISMWRGLSSSKRLTSAVVFYSFTTASCLLVGIFQQKKGVNSILYQILSTLCGCISSLLLYFFSGYVIHTVGTSLIGVAFGGIVSSSVNTIVQIVRTKQVPLATGFLHTLEGLFSFGVGPLYGYIRDESGSYEAVFLAIFCIQAACTVLFILAFLLNTRRA